MSQITRFILLLLFSLLLVTAYGKGKNKGKKSDRPVVTYDERSIIINGSRELLFSGSIHYPRAPPEMWQSLINEAKEGGLNLIQTYTFWNAHEPVKGQFNFEGNLDFIKFIKMIGDSGLWVTLRVGPYVEAEWNLGGFPYWLKEVPNVIFRTYNEPFMQEMKKYVEMILNMVKKEKLFADQGGPIIMAQIENEYNNVQLAYRENGLKYVKWAADMATSLYNGVPWVMCKQKDAPPQIISTCNGRQCGDTFVGPGPGKPSLWTENWTAQYRVFGDSPSMRAAEDISFSVLRFFARNGTLNNYYMYYGGTNFGRTSSSFVTTRYYDEAPLDEFGLRRDPKFGHLRDMHRALRLGKKALLWGKQNVQKITVDLEITTYEKDASACIAFLTNNHSRTDATIKFRGVDYFVPAKSVSVLPDCKTVVYNSQAVVSQHSSRNFVVSQQGKPKKWEMFREKIPTKADLKEKSKSPKELYAFTKDTSDYAWFSTSINFDRRDLPMRSDILPVLQVASLGHALAAFVNGEYVGFGHGSNIEKSHVFTKSIKLVPGDNHISLLAMTVGLPNSGAYMEKRFAGPRSIALQGLMAGTLDITNNHWGQQVGVSGEVNQIYKEEGLKKVKWEPYKGTPTPVTWYKTYFDAPEGNDPVAVRMITMGKGMIWVNGISMGRYWVSYVSALGSPTQEEYHIPRAFLKPKDNLLVIFEETLGSPEKIEIMTVNRDTICSIITDIHPPDVSSWVRKGHELRAVVDPLVKTAYLECQRNKVVEKVDFASFGDNDGACGNFIPGKCESSQARTVVEKGCLGKNSCTIKYDKNLLLNGKDTCPDVPKTLAIQLKCGQPKKSPI